AAIAYSQAGVQGVAALQSGQAIVSGGQLITNVEGFAFGTGSAVEGAAGSSAAGAGALGQGAGALAGSVVSGGLAAVALGFGTYSALQSARTTTDVAVNALSGAV